MKCQDNVPTQCVNCLRKRSVEFIMKVPKEESKEQTTDNTLNDDDDDMTNPYDTESNSDSIDPPTRDGDFSEYMWMENQEEFDLQVVTYYLFTTTNYWEQK